MDHGVQESPVTKRLKLQQAVHAMVNQSEQNALTPPKPRRLGGWVAVAAVTLFLAGASGYVLRAASVSTDNHKPDKIPTATVAATDAATTDDILKISGFFTAHDMVQISATVLARVKKILVSEGMSVKQGDLLVELSNVRGDNDVKSAQQKLTSVELHIQKAELDLRHEEEEQRRQANLMTQGFGTRKAMGDANLRLNQARLELARARSDKEDALANLRAFQNAQLEYAIRAPFSGLIVAQNARVGEVVSPTNGGSCIRSGLLALLNPATLEVEVSVQERLLPQLKSAGCALVSSLAQPEQIHAVPFQLSRISNTADRQRGAVNAVLVPRQPMRVLPILETSAEVQFVRAGDSRCSSHSPVDTQ